MSASENFNNIKTLDVVAMAMKNTNTNEYLLARRCDGGPGDGQWEFPGGKIEAGETQEMALHREIMEELSVDISQYAKLYIANNTLDYGGKVIRIFLWLIQVNKKPDLVLVDHDRAEWFLLNQFEEIALSKGDKFFISLLK